MQKKHSILIITCIALVALFTFALQFYWNYQNYQASRISTQEEIHQLLEKSISMYFEEQSKKDMVSFLSEEVKFSTDDFLSAIRIDTLFKEKTQKINYDSLPKFPETNNIQFKSASSDSNNNTSFEIKNLSKVAVSSINAITVTRDSASKPKIIVLKGQKSIDSIGDLTRFKNRIVISMSRDSLNYAQLDSLIQNNLLGKQLPIDWQLYHIKDDTLRFPVEKILSQFPNIFQSKSSFVNKNESIEIQYNLPQSIIFKKIGVEILLSFLLSIIILFFLIYLLQIIKKQQKMDAYKNDFISNMTHEFKTPITTIKTALEGLTHFNQENNPEKTAKYLQISNEQLEKLNLLVEKILETSTLKSTQWKLEYEVLDLQMLLEKIVLKFKTLSNKEIVIQNPFPSLKIQTDAFHVEQILSNLLDNAVKYGGNKIVFSVTHNSQEIQIHCADNGKGIEKSDQKKIFEQFYRVSKGNQHDVKGFGIGLFYAQNMAQKLGGNLLYQNQTLPTFTLILPHEQSH